jgi:acyl-CoA dehydrogenase
LFVLEKGMPGFTVSRKLEKLGWHASDTAELAFEGMCVPEGEPARRGEQWERLAMALAPLGRWEHVVAELAVRHEASRSLTYHALRLFAGGSDALREVTAAKLLSQRAAFEVAETAFRMLDGDLEMGRGDARHPPRADRRRHRRGDAGDPRGASSGCKRARGAGRSS